MKLNRNIKSWNYRKFINYFLGPLLFVWLSWSIYNEIRNQTGLKAALEVFSSAKLFYFIPVVLLMVLNWSIEAMKWKVSVKPIQKIGFLKAFRAVLSGVSFSVSTPNRIGEYLGRVLYMDEGNRLRTISMTMVGSLSQLIITILMGAAGLIVMKQDIEAAQLISGIWFQVILYGVLAVLLVLTVFYFRLSWLVKLINRLPGSKRFLYLVQTLEELDATLLLRLLSFSLLRFVIFIVQYYLLFQLFDVELNMWQVFWTVSVVFLIMAVIPTFAIAELAQRGYVAKTIVGLYSGNIAGIIFVTTGIWLINLVLPAIVGSLLILGIKKLYKEEDEQT
ncbi:MAG: flippase-like domain-containing protein [Chitinophagaceae bacterium]|nr:flippase-like domain-containing protein [Chitinophagaceae bacterium]